MLGVASGSCRTASVPGPAGPGVSRSCTSSLSRRARAASRLRSPRHTSSHGWRTAASARHSSGPIPAGSPEVNTTRGILRLVFDVGIVAHTPQPQLSLLVGLAGADRFHGLPALDLVGVVDAAAPEHLRDVPAELRVERLADLVVLEAGDRLLELRRERARSGPAKIAALGGRARILGGHLGDTGEILALGDALAQHRQLGA